MSGFSDRTMRCSVRAPTGHHRCGGSAYGWSGSLLGGALAIGWSDMPAWLAWLIAAALLGVAELVTLTFAAGLMAAAAVIAAVVAGAGGGIVAQAAAFVGASFAAL